MPTVVPYTYEHKRERAVDFYGLVEPMKILVATVIMGIFVKIANPSGIFGILVVILVAVIIYFVVLFLLKGINKKEINLIKGMI